MLVCNYFSIGNDIRESVCNCLWSDHIPIAASLGTHKHHWLTKSILTWGHHPQTLIHSVQHFWQPIFFISDGLYLHKIFQVFVSVGFPSLLSIIFFFFLLLVQSKCKVYQSIMCCRTFIIFNLRRKYYRWKVSYFFIVLSITGKAYHMTMWNWNYTELSWKIQPSGIIWHNMCHITTTLTKRCTVLPWNSFKLWFYY